jgi:hypothetical protein
MVDNEDEQSILVGLEHKLKRHARAAKMPASFPISSIEFGMTPKHERQH